MDKIKLFSKFKIVFNDEAYTFFEDVYNVLKKVYDIDSMILLDMDHEKCLSYGINKNNFEIEPWMKRYVDKFVKKDDVFYSFDCKNDKEFEEVYDKLNSRTSLFIPLKAIVKMEPNFASKKVFIDIEDLISINFKEKNAITEKQILQLSLLVNQYLIRYQVFKELKSFVNVNSAIYEETPFGLMVVDRNFIANINTSGRDILELEKKGAMICAHMGLCYYCNKKRCKYRDKHLIQMKNIFSQVQINKLQKGLDDAFEKFNTQTVRFWYKKKYLRFNIVPFVLENESLKRFYEDKNRKSLISAIVSFQDITDTIEKQKLKRDFEIARKIQMDLLPRRELSLGDFQIKAAYIPAQEVGGDYYDIINMKEDGKMGFVLGDISGKGLPSALFVSELKGVIHSAFSFCNKIEDIVYFINNYLRESKKRNFFVTMFIGIIDIDEKKLRWVLAGHNQPLFYEHNKDEVAFMQNTGIGFNLVDSDTFMNNIKVNEIFLKKGDTLLLYTDGVVERMNERDEIYGEERLKENFIKNAHRSSPKIVKNLLKDLKKFVENTPRNDDITILSIKSV